MRLGGTGYSKRFSCSTSHSLTSVSSSTPSESSRTNSSECSSAAAPSDDSDLGPRARSARFTCRLTNRRHCARPRSAPASFNSAWVSQPQSMPYAAAPARCRYAVRTRAPNHASMRFFKVCLLPWSAWNGLPALYETNEASYAHRSEGRSHRSSGRTCRRRSTPDRIRCARQS
eukprot:1587965-Prymnesium_polylepis.3